MAATIFISPIFLKSLRLIHYAPNRLFGFGRSQRVDREARMWKEKLWHYLTVTLIPGQVQMDVMIPSMWNYSCENLHHHHHIET